tara:strand:+ start:986 stop:1519 length:534 start_codon:yes stop_codon:yes gene_type:complete
MQQCNFLKKHETRKATMTQQSSIKALALQVLSRKHHAQQECNSKFHCRDYSVEQIADFATNNIIKFKSPEFESNGQSLEPTKVTDNKVECFDIFENESDTGILLNARKVLYPDVHIPDTELRIVYELYRTAIIEGSALYQCKDEEQANRWVQHFNRNLPTDRGAGVIRENELNIYSQ